MWIPPAPIRDHNNTPATMWIPACTPDRSVERLKGVEDTRPGAHHVARAVGVSPPRRWPACLVAAAAVGAVLAGSAFAVTAPNRTTPAVTTPTPSPVPSNGSPAQGSYSANRAAAEAESARVVELVPLPPDAVRFATAIRSARRSTPATSTE
jgi:hypothetical protein